MFFTVNISVSCGSAEGMGRLTFRIDDVCGGRHVHIEKRKIKWQRVQLGI